jgi:hypothetical protein
MVAVVLFSFSNHFSNCYGQPRNLTYCHVSLILFFLLFDHRHYIRLQVLERYNSVKWLEAYNTEI